jgi:hypothetical protein
MTKIDFSCEHEPKTSFKIIKIDFDYHIET